MNSDSLLMTSLYWCGTLFLGTVGTIDNHIAQWLNQLSAVAGPANRFLVLLSEANFIKVMPFVAVAAWYWNCEPRSTNRQTIVNGFTGIFLALLLGRILQLTLPFRARPIHTAGLDLQLPAAMTPDILGGWSSFPSDHAAVFAALVGMVFALSRVLGRIGLAYAIIVVLLPRVCLGLHFLSDVVAGFAVGAAASWLAQSWPANRFVGPFVERLSLRHPAAFYSFSILLLAQLVQMFGDVRRYSSIAKGLIVGTL